VLQKASLSLSDLHSYFFQLLRSKSPSGECAKLHNVAASNKRVHLMRSHFYCLTPHDIYMGVILHAHPVCGESHIQRNINPEVAF